MDKVNKLNQPHGAGCSSGGRAGLLLGQSVPVATHDPQDAHARIHRSVSARLKALGGARVNVGVRGSSPFSVDLSCRSECV